MVVGVTVVAGKVGERREGQEREGKGAPADAHGVGWLPEEMNGLWL